MSIEASVSWVIGATCATKYNFGRSTLFARNVVALKEASFDDARAHFSLKWDCRTACCFVQSRDRERCIPNSLKCLSGERNGRGAEPARSGGIGTLAVTNDLAVLMSRPRKQRHSSRRVSTRDASS